ncbi:MAG TPA: hypothetical protein VKT32_12800 [Chthonomonadaceae bacterium]|nr:hypothetical protein [Chthonomonadaceae bacterium]
MPAYKEGDRVRIVRRPATPADAKTGLYYGYYGGLSGTLFKLYGRGEAAQAAVEVDLESLPEDVARRHLEVRDQMRAALTGAARRASAPGAEHEFRLRYVLLVALTDLQRSPLARPKVSNGKRD